MTLSDVFAISASIIVAIGGAGAIIFGLSSWLGNILANIFIDKHKSKLEQELESFKSYLAREKDREIEQLKSELNLISLKFQTEHSNLFSQRVDIIRYIYDGLIDISDQSARTLWFAEASKKTDEIRQNAKKYYDDVMRLGRYFDKSKIFLEPDLCLSIDKAISLASGSAAQYLGTVELYDDHEISETKTIRDHLWEQVETEVTAAISAVEIEFRNIMLEHVGTISNRC